MSHQQQRDFCERTLAAFPEAFTGRRVLDYGSWDVNGNNRYLFTDCEYMGIDVAEGENVDAVCPAHLFWHPHPFDTIISTECLEHDPFWRQTLQHTTWLLRSGGFYFFTCATTGRPEHGTSASLPTTNNAALAKLPAFVDYYQNLTIADIAAAIDLPRLFSRYAFEVDIMAADLYFWGVKI